jgi:uncharacterized protein YwgA
VDRRLLPLLLASDRFSDQNETEPLDRLRMQKGVFLLERRGRTEWNTAFEFTPYDYGPYSFDLASTVDQMVADGLLSKEPFPGRRYSRYRTTALGEQVLDADNELSERDLSFVSRTRKYVNTRSFSRLLREVYQEYPEFAVNSRFQG